MMAFVPAEYDVAVREEREMLLDPLIFRRERSGIFHGRRGDEYLIVFYKLAKDFLTALHYWNVPKKVFCSRVISNALSMLEANFW